MKFLSLLLLLFSSAIYAQNQSINEHLPDHRPSETNYKFKGAYHHWKWPTEAAKSIGGTFTQKMNFLFPDSSVVWVDGVNKDSIYHHKWHAAGAVFDPTDPIFEIYDDGIRLSRFQWYEVDSIYFPYSYVRYIDSITLNGLQYEVVDTLIVQFLNYEQLEFDQLNTDEIYAKSSQFSADHGGHPNPEYQIKILLTRNEATKQPGINGWQTKAMYVDVPDIRIPEDQILEGKRVSAFNIFFKTMVPYESGDTLEIPADTTFRGLNYFGHAMPVNEGNAVPQYEHFNNAYFTNGAMAFGDTINGWANNVPGNAYNDDRYFYYAFKIFNFVNIHEYELPSAVLLYPNPVEGKAINLRSNDLGLDKIVISNILGESVAFQIKDQAHDLKSIEFQELLPKGIYIIRIETTQGIITQKFQVE